MFQHQIPSPVEITKWATKYFPFSNRHFPNQGLTGEQMALAIREVGLEPYLYNVADIDTLRATIYAYAMGKIPMVLGFSLLDIDEKSQPISRGRHAVAVCGFCTGSGTKLSYRNIAKLQLTASRIDKLYVHDDQIGPFASMELDGSIEVDDRQYQFLKTTWPSAIPEEYLIGLPELLIIPLYHKIRIPFERVQVSINSFNHNYLMVSKWLSEAGMKDVFPIIEWNIHLITISDLKSSILQNSRILGEYKASILTKRLPKYLWRAEALIENASCFDFLMDATDIDQGTFFILKIDYDLDFCKRLQEFMAHIDVSNESDMTLRDMINSFQIS